MIKDYCEKINNFNPYTFDSWYNKIISKGNVIAIQSRGIIAFLLLYCTQKESLDGYICNVCVLESFRGLGLSVKLLDKAIKVCKGKGFASVSLHVDRTNIKAIRVYEKYGFISTGQYKYNDDGIQMEMRYFIQE